MDSRWIHYERLARWPERLVVVGEAVCALDAVCDEDMTTVTAGVIALVACLREQAHRRPDGNLDGLSRRFQRRLARSITPCWDVLRSGGESGPPGAGMRRGAMLLLALHVPWLTRLVPARRGIYRAVRAALHGG